MSLLPQIPRDGSDFIAVNLFFALRPDPATRFLAETLALGLPRVHGLKGQAIDAERLHLSLCPVPLGRCDLMETVERAKAAAARVTAPDFEIGLNVARGFSGHDGRHPFVLACGETPAALRALRRQLGVEMIQSGLGDPLRQGFTPHMTLLWADRVVEARPILPLRWTVREFALVLSLVGHARHITLGCWPLR